MVSKFQRGDLFYSKVKRLHYRRSQFSRRANLMPRAARFWITRRRRTSHFYMVVCALMPIVCLYEGEPIQTTAHPKSGHLNSSYCVYTAAGQV